MDMETNREEVPALRPVLARAIKLAGGAVSVAQACGVSHVAVYKWLRNGRLPRTEYSGETHYSDTIVAACRKNDPAAGITREQLLGMQMEVRAPRLAANG